MDPASLFRVVNAPASPADIAALLEACGPLPTSYSEFLVVADGVEWCFNDRGGDCLALWRAKEISELNQAYNIHLYLPKFLAIGSDGGGDESGEQKRLESELVKVEKTAREKAEQISYTDPLEKTEHKKFTPLDFVWISGRENTSMSSRSG